MTTLTHNGHRIDETSQIILQTLRSRRSEMTTGDLRRQSDTNQNQQVRYRIREHLEPAGFVAEAGTHEMPEGSPDAQLWTITNDGINWVDEHTEEIEDARDTAQLIEALKHTREHVDDLSDEMRATQSDIENRTETWQNTMNRRSQKLTRFGNRIEELEERVNQTEESAQKAWTAASNADETTEEIQAELSRLTNTVADLRHDLDELTELADSFDELEEDMTDTDRTVKSLRNELEEVRKEAQAARREAKRPFYAKLKERLLER